MEPRRCLLKRPEFSLSGRAFAWRIEESGVKVISEFESHLGCGFEPERFVQRLPLGRSVEVDPVIIVGPAPLQRPSDDHPGDPLLPESWLSIHRHEVRDLLPWIRGPRLLIPQPYAPASRDPPPGSLGDEPDELPLRELPPDPLPGRALGFVDPCSELGMDVAPHVQSVRDQEVDVVGTRAREIETQPMDVASSPLYALFLPRKV